MLDLGYRHVDVFSRRALQGNGLVVVLDAENLSAAVMQELRQCVARSRLRQVMLPTFELPVLARRTVTCKAAARHRVASSLCPMENIGGPWTERENDRSGRAPEASTQLTLEHR